MREPHDSLAAFLGDLHEQCAVFRQSTRSPLVNLVLAHLQVTLVSSALVVSIDEREHHNKMEKR